MWMRTTVAFVVAPAIGALGASVIAATMWGFYFGFFFSTLVVAYFVAVVIGIPWFLVWPRLPTSIFGYALAGAAVAGAAAVLMVFILPLTLAFLSILVGALAGLTFGVIVMPTSNNRSRGP